jgi:hypothetical protein
MKSGSLNLLEPSGPHRACYGNPLPLPCVIPVHVYSRSTYEKRVNTVKIYFSMDAQTATFLSDLILVDLVTIVMYTFDVITSLVSLEHGVYSWENVTSE